MATVAVIIPNYNYAQFVGEAVASVFEQRVPADDVLVIDDGSTDDSRAVLDSLAARYGARLRVVYNDRNLGIVPTFAKAVGLTTTDYVSFLGADNRMKPDYIGRCKATLEANPNAGVAYIDLVIFGPLAEELAMRVDAEPLASGSTFRWRFSEPTPDALASLPSKNFIDGNSMFRRSAYEAAGGFRPSERAEDHDLFVRMVQAGFLPVHVPEALVEYRQHSREQANQVQLAERQLRAYRSAFEAELVAEGELRAELERVKALLESTRSIFPTRTPSEAAATMLVNLLAPHRRHAVRHALSLAVAKVRREPRPPTPPEVLTDDTI